MTAMVFSADDGCDVGHDSGAPVSPDYGAHGNAFNGRVKGVEIAIAEAAEHTDHLVSPEEAIRVALARQSATQSTREKRAETRLGFRRRRSSANR